MRKIRFEGLAVVAITLASGCGDKAPDVEAGFANLRAIHLSQGAPEVDVLLNGGPEAVVTDLSFTDSSGYNMVARGSYLTEIISVAGDVLLTTNVDLADQQSYTLAIFDRPESIQTKLFVDTFNVPSGQIHIRLFNTAVGAGPMALYFIPEDNSAPQKLTGEISYGNASEAVEIADGNHDVALDIDLDGVIDATFDMPPLSDGTLANVFAVFDANGDLDLVLEMNDGFTWELDGHGNIGGGNDARARVVHLIPNAPVLSAFTAGATLASGLAFMQESAYVGVPAGSFDVTVGETMAMPLFTVMDASFEANNDYTVVLFGNTAMPTGRTLLQDDANIPAGQARIRLIHTAADVGELDIFDFNAGGEPIELSTDLEYGEASDTIDIAPGVYRFGVDANDDGVFDVFFDMPTLVVGELTNIYAVMDNGNPRMVTQSSAGLVSVATVMP